MDKNIPVISIINCTQQLEYKEIFEKIDTRFKKDGNWQIDNKYYSAKFNLIYHSLESDFQISSLTEAIIFLFSMEEPYSFEFIKTKLNIVDKINPPVKLLICNQFVSSDVLNIDIIKDWSIQNDFEIIELEQSTQNSDEEDDDFPDIVGFDRIIEVLNCNSWSNSHFNDITKSSSYAYNILNSKESDENCSKSSKSSLNSDSGDASNTDANEFNSTDIPKTINSALISHNNTQEIEISVSKKCHFYDNSDTENFCSDAGTEDYTENMEASACPVIQEENKCNHSDRENFEDLFQNLHAIKEKAQSLSFDDRKKYAEDMIKKFWLSMGGDENEFDEISDQES